MKPIPDGSAIIYNSRRAYSVKLLKYRCINNDKCPYGNELQYNGHGDGLVVLYKNKNQVTVIIPTLVFIKLSETIFRARTTEMDYYHSIQDNYASYNKSHHPSEENQLLLL
jgi:hypothetical protein